MLALIGIAGSLHGTKAGVNALGRPVSKEGKSPAMRLSPLVAIAALVELFCLAGCQSNPECRVAETQVLLNDVSRALAQSIRDDEGVLKRLPTDMKGADDLNAYLAKYLVQKEMLSAQVMRKSGSLVTDTIGRAVIVDAWGHPVVFQIPRLYPDGLVCTSSLGDTRILPLPSAVWPEEKGPIQCWSLGPNGLDNRGQGDDILPPN